jgi:hypothetical protein
MVAPYVDPRDAEIEKLKDLINVANMCVFGLMRRLAEADIEITDDHDEMFVQGVLLFGKLTRQYLAPEVVEAMRMDGD